MDDLRERKKGSCPTICVVTLISFSVVTIVVICLLVWRPMLLPYYFRIAKFTITEAMKDKQRLLDNELQAAQKEWRMYQIESRFGQDWCKENAKTRSDVTWLTIVVNDEFSIPALVLAHSIRTFSCQQNMIALVSDTLSKGAQGALQSVGWETRVVEVMDCDWLDAKLGANSNTGLFGRPRGHGIKGTHTRFHAWNYTEFSRIIYLDADYMLMTNIDELFDIPDDFAAAPCSRPGVVDPCFNAGLMVFRPDTKHYQQILSLWWKMTRQGTCPNDQILLWEYYVDVGNWKTIPYAFNIRRIIYRPLNSFHFACCRPLKPWSAECRPSRKEAGDYDRPVLIIDDMLLVFWKRFYELLGRYNLENWWRSTKLFRPDQEFGSVPFDDCNKVHSSSANFTLWPAFPSLRNLTNFNFKRIIPQFENYTLRPLFHREGEPYLQ